MPDNHHRRILANRRKLLGAVLLAALSGSGSLSYPPALLVML